ncbi:MAG: hypothetical protein P9X22_09570, partial [Candidatus Zapsychrus exili]|nr:hypothetical protein [Candidatus Zapsychrus exili]
MFKYFFYKIAQTIAVFFPLDVAYKIAVFLSDVQYFFSPRDRKAVRNNLKKILKSEDDLNSKTKEVFRNFGKYFVEFLRMEQMVNKDFIAKKVEVENIESIKQALEKGKGAIILTAHMGNWELGAVLISLLGDPLTAVALSHKERPVNNLFNHQREIYGITVVPTKNAVRKCLENLRNNKLTALVGDRDFGNNGEAIDFLGHKT